MNEHYFLDLDEIDNYIQIRPETSESSFSGETHINIVKYDTVKLLLEVLMDETEEVDETLGTKGAGHLSIPFKLAFNTLVSKNLLKSF